MAKAKEPKQTTYQLRLEQVGPKKTSLVGGTTITINPGATTDGELNLLRHAMGDLLKGFRMYLIQQKIYHPETNPQGQFLPNPNWEGTEAPVLINLEELDEDAVAPLKEQYKEVISKDKTFLAKFFRGGNVVTFEEASRF